jgi:asparagine synthase (glutamine-hydrolysing)
MCGIVGALSFRGSAFGVTPAYVTRMRAAVAHRGPDGAGLWVDAGGRIGLGHQRLSIIDLSPNAAQPMSSADGNLWIVFNGEIYNHAAIRAS